jgi:REP element-mobilizing transposase RayT
VKYEPEKYYHLYNRGANKVEIFLSQENYFSCLQLMHKYAIEYKISVLAYCLMPNHYHFLLKQSGGGSIQGWIQTLFDTYTPAFNKQHQRSGTLFEGKAKAHEVDNDMYSIQLCAYIHLNPVSAHLVKTPEEWEFSDYKEWIDIRQSDYTDLALRNSYFDNGKQYHEFIESQRLDRVDDKFDRLKLD